MGATALGQMHLAAVAAAAAGPAPPAAAPCAGHREDVGCMIRRCRVGGIKVALSSSLRHRRGRRSHPGRPLRSTSTLITEPERCHQVDRRACLASGGSGAISTHTSRHSGADVHKTFNPCRPSRESIALNAADPAFGFAVDQRLAEQLEPWSPIPFQLVDLTTATFSLCTKRLCRSMQFLLL